MNILNLLNTAALVICVAGVMTAGCGKAPEVTERETPPASAIAPAVEPAIAPLVVVADPTPTPVPTFSLTYYTASVTRTPQPANYSWINYTSIGYCAVYNSKTYCWDDGIHVVNFPIVAGHTFLTWYQSYWNICAAYIAGSTFEYCGGDEGREDNNGVELVTTDDLMVTPILMDQAITINVPAGALNAVLHGTPNTVSCSETDGIVDCGTFQIDTTQVGL